MIHSMRCRAGKLQCQEGYKVNGHLIAKGVIVEIVDVRHVNCILEHTPAEAQLTSYQQRTALLWTWLSRKEITMLSSSEAPD